MTRLRKKPEPAKFSTSENVDRAMFLFRRLVDEMKKCRCDCGLCIGAKIVKVEPLKKFFDGKFSKDTNENPNQKSPE